MDAPNAEPARTPIPVGVACPDCGYDLRTSTSDRCPECGYTLELLRTTESQIPWVHRRRLGRFRAYWYTVWQVLRRPKKFSLEMLRPVNAADSRSFRWITVLHAYLPILAASLAWLATGWFAGRAGSGTLFIFAHVQISALWLLGLLPGAVSYSFQLPGMSVERQNRAIALSYYAWAPLALAPLTIALGTAGAWLLMWPYGNAWSDLFGVFAMLPCGMLLFWPVGVAHEFRRFGLRQFIANSRAYRFAIGLLALAVFVGAFLLPLSLLYISAIVYSLL